MTAGVHIEIGDLVVPGPAVRAEAVATVVADELGRLAAAGSGPAPYSVDQVDVVVPRRASAQDVGVAVARAVWAAIGGPGPEAPTSGGPA